MAQQAIDKNTKFFEFLGCFVAKALLDQRLLDIPFAMPFLKRILNIPLQLRDLSDVMPELVKSMEGFMDILAKKKEIESNSLLSAAEMAAQKAGLLYKGATLEDMCLSFVYPGAGDAWELIANGANITVTLDNLEEYINAIVKIALHDSTQRQFNSFVAGFNQVFPIRRLRVFTVEELDMLLCGSAQDQQTWDKASTPTIRFDAFLPILLTQLANCSYFRE